MKDIGFLPIKNVMNKILLVEDNPELLESTAELLELKGYEVHTAINGKIGLERAKSLRPHLIISDIMMPKMDGYDMLNALRAIPETALIPFIFLTAKAQKTDILRGAASGADRYLVKPFQMKDLLKAINAILGWY